MKECKMLVTFSLPGSIVNVEDNRVTVTFNTLDQPILTVMAVESLTKGMSDLEADVLLERIHHFAISESLRARIGLSGITERRAYSESVEPVKASPKGWEAV